MPGTTLTVKFPDCEDLDPPDFLRAHELDHPAVGMESTRIGTALETELTGNDAVRRQRSLRRDGSCRTEGESLSQLELRRG